MNSSSLLLLFVMAALRVHEGEGLKCWMCDTIQLGGCSDPFLGSSDVKEDLLFTKDCESKLVSYHTLILPNGTTYTADHTAIVNAGLKLVCLKITGKLFGEKFVFRNCALGLPNITEGSCVQSVLGSELHIRSGGTIEKCETCNGDLCNGAYRMTIFDTTGMLMAPLLLLLK